MNPAHWYCWVGKLSENRSLHAAGRMHFMFAGAEAAHAHFYQELVKWLSGFDWDHVGRRVTNESHLALRTVALSESPSSHINSSRTLTKHKFFLRLDRTLCNRIVNHHCVWVLPSLHLQILILEALKEGPRGGGEHLCSKHSSVILAEKILTFCVPGCW